MNNQPNQQEIQETITTTNNNNINFHENINNNDDSLIEHENSDIEENNHEENNVINQTVITNIQENYPFGDIMGKKHHTSICIFSKNINGICAYNSWSAWDNACLHSKLLDIDIIGHSEK
jgi:hypothetical protein